MKMRTFGKAGMIVIVAIAMALVSCLLLVACGSSTTSSKSTTTASSSEPPLQPAGAHEQRWELGGYKMCYGCHGVNSSGKTMNGYAPAIPDDHYVNGDKSTMQLDAERQQCIQCHPVATE